MDCHALPNEKARNDDYNDSVNAKSHNNKKADSNNMESFNNKYNVSNNLEFLNYDYNDSINMESFNDNVVKTKNNATILRNTKRKDRVCKNTEMSYTKPFGEQPVSYAAR